MTVLDFNKSVVFLLVQASFRVQIFFQQEFQGVVVTSFLKAKHLLNGSGMREQTGVLD